MRSSSSSLRSVGVPAEPKRTDYVVLSHALDPELVLPLVDQSAQVGHLLKDRVLEPQMLVDTVRLVIAGRVRRRSGRRGGAGPGGAGGRTPSPPSPSGRWRSSGWLRKA